MDDLVLVDTSAWICFFARKNFINFKNSISILLDENRIAIAGLILVELVQGAKTIREKKDIERNIKSLHWLQITDDHWHSAADLSFNLRRKGVTVSAIDTLISVIARSYNCQLLHRDNDFELIAKYSPLKLFDVNETR